MKYRAEIDGLRALAVVPVIFFHAGFEWFSGGFVGVDVFFVISGFLITTILVEDLENNQFSIAKFYERRARRILPALFVVMLTCLPFAWMWMLPSQLIEFFPSLIAVSLFVSNYLFWLESGYFAAEVEEKPLLHTWSLSVEEQYYVLFPIFLFFAWRSGKNRVFWMIVVMTAFSLMLSELGWRNKPTGNFFLTPNRAWELFSGSIAAFIVQWRGVRSNNILSCLGLAGVIFSIFAYDKNTPFPSLYTLVPVVGVVLLVLYADKETWVAKLLSTKVFVGIGLISYSAYLWHQPLFAFARIRLIEEPSMYLMGFLSLVSLVLGYVSWKFIEKPFRGSSPLIKDRKKLFLASGTALITMLVIGNIGILGNGFSGRFKAQLTGDFGHTAYHKLVDELYTDCEPASVANEAMKWHGHLRCKQTRPGELDWVLLGDSHAEHLFLGLAEEHPEKNIGFYMFPEKPYVNQAGYENIFKALAEAAKPKLVMLNMYYIFREKDSQKLKQEYRKTISYLQSMGHEVVLLGDTPNYILYPETCVYSGSFETAVEYCTMTQSNFDSQRELFEPVLIELADEFGIKYISLHEPLCDGNECSMVRDGEILYRDTTHLNIPGSRLIGQYLSKALMN